MATRAQIAAIGIEMRQHANAFYSSGLNLRQYCADKDFTIHKLNYWLNKLIKEQNPVTNTGGFRRVKAKAALPLPPLMCSRLPLVEVTLTNGTRITFFESISPNHLKVLL